jgi:hypothetical protein
MSEPSLFGIGKQQWELINSFGNWLSAIGTLAAVWASLYLARSITKPKAKVTVGHRIALQPGQPAPYPEFVLFSIVNTGERPLRVTQIGWRVGAWNKRFAIQQYEERSSSPLPVELSHGQEARWIVPLHADNHEPWLNHFAKRMLLPNARLSCASLRAQFFTSVGHVFYAKPEAVLLEKLRAAARQDNNDDG